MHCGTKNIWDDLGIGTYSPLCRTRFVILDFDIKNIHYLTAYFNTFSVFHTHFVLGIICYLPACQLMSTCMLEYIIIKRLIMIGKNVVLLRHSFISILFHIIPFRIWGEKDITEIIASFRGGILFVVCAYNIGWLFLLLLNDVFEWSFYRSDFYFRSCFDILSLFLFRWMNQRIVLNAAKTCYKLHLIGMIERGSLLWQVLAA